MTPARGIAFQTGSVTIGMLFVYFVTGNSSTLHKFITLFSGINFMDFAETNSPGACAIFIF
jgi:hypothetical protein